MSRWPAGCQTTSACFFVELPAMEEVMSAQVELIRWDTSLAQAHEVAAREGKAILLDFSAAPQ